jgi:hypothetical protein
MIVSVEESAIPFRIHLDKQMDNNLICRRVDVRLLPCDRVMQPRSVIE